MNAQYWIDKAILHAGYLAGLQDGSLGKSDLWNSAMTIPEAIQAEQRSVEFCVREAGETLEARICPNHRASLKYDACTQAFHGCLYENM